MKTSYFIFCLLYIILFVGVYMFTTQKEKYIEFLEKNDGCKVFQQDSSYFNNMTQADKDARNLSLYSDDILIQYCDKLKTFTKEEKTIISEMIYYFNKNMKNETLKTKILHNWKFAKGSQELENGYPHTHNDTIFLTQSLLDKILETKNTSSLSDMIQKVGYVLLHEKIHIWQKKEPQLFFELYTSVLNFKKIQLEESDKKYIKSFHRNNPDGEDFEWVLIFNDLYYIPLAKYKTKSPEHLGDVEYVLIEIKKTKEKYTLDYPIELKPINTFLPFHQYYSLQGNHYHPNEISAEIISLICIELMGLKYPYTKTVGYNKIDKWIQGLNTLIV